MILDFIFGIISTLLNGVMYLLPSLPAMPTEITDATDWLVDQVGLVSGFFAYLYGPVFFAAILGAVVVLLNFEFFFHTFQWIWRKLPISSK